MNKSTTRRPSAMKPTSAMKQKRAMAPKQRRNISTKKSKLSAPLLSSSLQSISQPSPQLPQLRRVSVSPFSSSSLPSSRRPLTKPTPSILSSKLQTFTNALPTFTPQLFSFPSKPQLVQSSPFSTASPQTAPTTAQPSHFTTTTSLTEDGIEVPAHLETKYKRLLFQSQQRGWLELDLIFTAYVKTNKKQLLNEKSIEELTIVCDCDNSDLIRWFVEGVELPEEWKANSVMVDMLQYAHHPNKPWYPGANNGNQ